MVLRRDQHRLRRVPGTRAEGHQEDHCVLVDQPLGYVMLGLASLDLIGIQGAILQMVSHGLVAGGLFLMVGMIYERCHTRDIAAYGGLAKILAGLLVFFALLTSPRSDCRRRAVRR
jgi:hypothetical protein